MVATLFEVTETVPNGLTLNKSLKGKFLLYGALFKYSVASIAVYFRYPAVADNNGSTTAPYKWYMNYSNPFVMFTEPVLIENGLTIGLYNNSGASTEVGVTLLIKRLDKM